MDQHEGISVKPPYTGIYKLLWRCIEFYLYFRCVTFRLFLNFKCTHSEPLIFHCAVRAQVRISLSVGFVNTSGVETIKEAIHQVQKI